MSAPLILGTNSIKDTGYDVDNSLRFDDGSSDYLNQTFASNGTRTTWTFSTWIKRSNLGSDQRILSCDDDASGNQDDFIKFLSGDTFQIGFYNSGFYGERTTNRVFRDVSAWFHIVVVWDTTNATADDRIRLYVNGVRETSFSSSTNPSSSANSFINSTSYPLEIGRRGLNGTQYINGYLAETVFVDGQALEPTSFGEFDSDTGIWKPIDVSGLTFGTNGFYLDFEDSSALGNDVSGNDNDFTVNSLTSIDQTTDTCTNNYATLNPIAFENASGTNRMSEGNLRFDGDSSTAHNLSVGTIAVNQGKWWFEAEIDAYGGSNPSIGIASYDVNLTLGNYVGGITGTIGYTGNGNINENGSNLVTGLNSYTSGDIINVGLDLDNNKIYFYKNGSLENTGGTSITNRLYSFAVSQYSNTGHWFANFGAGTLYSISSGNSDANGYGNFEFSVPSGYYALNSKNLAEYG